ncbi:MAG TPA: rhodanese-like domain-containing protein [Gemmatimonadales bacterium]|nr:rhodanese-like domain-containing protein [Gemmatimonadales bacterium]
MTPEPKDPDVVPTELPAVRRISVAEAQALVTAGRAVLVDTRDRRLYDNAHAAGAVSLPLSAIEAAKGQLLPDSVPPDRLLILYCA